MTPAPQTGRVIASHGRRVTVETADGTAVFCKVSGRRLEVVCGDEVVLETVADGGEGIVIERLPRRSALSRTDAVGRAETIVANITQLVVILAPKPAPDFFVIDRYLAAAELLGIAAVLALNKADLVDAGFAPQRAELDVFARIGYAILECSATAGSGILQLQERLRGQTSILVGQSGAGKSSLANRLLPTLNSATSELTRGTAEGKHTTSVSTLHHLPSGGDLIDSPGVRDFAPAIELLRQPAHGFREFVPLIASCRFQDCRHLREPGCAIQAAVASGHISERRYESYRRLLRLSEELAPAPGSRRRDRDLSRNKTQR